MLATSSLYKAIVADPKHWEENRVVINGVEYYDDILESADTSSCVFADSALSIGGAIVGEAEVVLRKTGVPGAELSKLIPRQATMDLYVRVCRQSYYGGGTVDTRGIVGIAVVHRAVVGRYNSYGGEVEYSEWIPQGKYLVDSREAVGWSERLVLRGMDKMALANADYPSTSSHGWPTTPANMIGDIATAIGVTVDSETQTLVNGWSLGDKFQLPTEFSMREVLGYIAAAFGGNFVISKEGKLKLLQVYSLPAETEFLVREDGDTFVISPSSGTSGHILLRGSSS